MANETTTAAPQTSELTKASKDLAASVNNRINAMAANGEIQVAPNYSPANSIKFAVLKIQNDEKLSKCSEHSKANALLSMVVQGLNPIKAQCYFIPYGTEVQLQPSYFGKMAIAMRTGLLAAPPKAHVIYADDTFEYTVDVETGNVKVTKHEQRITNIDNSKIVGAYATTRFKDGTSDTTVMNMKQIEAAWNQGQMKGKSGAHNNFREEMAKKTVIGRALKNVINSSDDAYLFDMEQESEDNTTGSLPAFEDADFTEVTEQHAAEASNEPQTAETETSNEPF